MAHFLHVRNDGEIIGNKHFLNESMFRSVSWVRGTDGHILAVDNEVFIQVNIQNGI